MRQVNGENDLILLSYVDIWFPMVPMVLAAKFCFVV